MTRTRPRKRRGSILLEVVVGLAVTGTIAGSALHLSALSLRRASAALERERAVAEASQLLTAVSVWPRSDLELRLGRTTQGPIMMVIEAMAPEEFTITLISREWGDTLLETTFWRPDRP